MISFVVITCLFIYYLLFIYYCRRILDRCACSSEPIVILTTYDTFRNSCQELKRAPHFYQSNCLLTKMELEAMGEVDIDDDGIEENKIAGEKLMRIFSINILYTSEMDF